MRLFLALLFFGCGIFAARSSVETSETTLVLVLGAPGEPQFEEQFLNWAEPWEKAAGISGATLIRVGFDGAPETRPISLVEKNGLGANGEQELELEGRARPDRELLQEILEAEIRKPGGELWLVLIGHGTFDGREAKFNLRGPDVSAAELAGWLKDAERSLAVINCASSSGPFIHHLSGPDRVIITATKSGYEQNFARFGKYLSSAILNLESDLDKDGQVSLLEAFLAGSRQLAEFYEAEGRLATEHPLLDDNGDGLGTPPDWFRGIRPVKKATEGAAPDGWRAHQFHLIRSEQEQSMPAEIRERRDQLELKVIQFRDAREKMEEEVYYDRLEALLLELAQLYEEYDRQP